MEWLILSKTEILYYNNNDNIHVSSGIGGFIFVFVCKNSVLFVEWEWFSRSCGNIGILPEKNRYNYTAMYVCKTERKNEIVNTNKNK
jgi:hypothetical protein